MISMYGVSGTTDDVASSGPEMKGNITAVQRQKTVTSILVKNELLIFLGHSRHPLSCA